MSELFYTKPAAEWEEALPLGNGRMGAMVYAGVENERLQLNEESIWYGGKMDRDNPDTLSNLPEIRRLLLEGEIKKAERLMYLTMSGCPESAHPYQTLGDLYLHFETEGEAEDYTRRLDIDNAEAVTEYTVAGVRYKRTIFASKPADCIVMCFEADRPGAVSFAARLTREQRAYNGVKKLGTDGICMYGDLGKYGYDFSVILRARAQGGSIRLLGENLVAENADKVWLYLGADCTFHYPEELAQRLKAGVQGADCQGTEGRSDMDRCYGAAWEGRIAQELLEEKIQAVLGRAIDRDYEELHIQHREDYGGLYNRVEFVLDGTEQENKLPTDQRLERAAKGTADVGLSKLYFDYGRYLLISCSRPGGLPATLQGLWNKDMLPPWDCKFTININTEMNYWPAENCNLSECHEPLFGHLKRMLPHGQRTAQVMYGCRGFVAHHNTDIHGETSVQDLWIPGSYWVMGAAWLCTHQWTHYLYTQDKEFLKENFHIMREAALFFLDFLIEVDGYLMTCPSVSPENSYVLPSGEKGANGVGVTMDNQILRDLFTQCIKAAAVLGVEDELNDRIKEARDKLLPTRIGSDGRILEWREEYEEFEPGHRHISHLYGMHPSSQITMDGTPELAAAARKTLEARLSHGGGHTGWSRAWIINHYAKLWDGEAAYDNLCRLFGSSTYPNMFDKHPPFQIDGNFGATAAIGEMLVQSSEERIVLLPALPKAWNGGHIKGLRVVGNGEISLWWKDGELTRAELTAHSDMDTVVKYKGERHISCKAGETVEIRREAQL